MMEYKRPSDSRSISEKFVDILDKVDFQIRDSTSYSLIKMDYINIVEDYSGRLLCEVVISTDNKESYLDETQEMSDSDYLLEAMLEDERFDSLRKNGFITVRDAHSALRSRFKSSKQLSASLKDLSNRGFIRTVTHKNPNGGRPSKVIELLYRKDSSNE